MANEATNGGGGPVAEPANDSSGIDYAAVERQIDAMQVDLDDLRAEIARRRKADERFRGLVEDVADALGNAARREADDA